MDVPPFVMISKESAKRVGKDIIGYPQHTVPVVSSKDWIGNLKRNPKDAVRRTSSFDVGDRPLILLLGCWISSEFVPDHRVASAL